MNKSSKIGKYLLALAVTVSVATPIVCLPIGINKSTNYSLIVKRAYADTFPEAIKTEEELAQEALEAQALAEADSNLMQVGEGVLLTATYDEGYCPPTMEDTTYRDVSPYVVYQNYDSAGLPVELLETQFFAPDETYLYVAATSSILKEKPDMDSITVQSLYLGQGVTRVGIGDTWSKIVTEGGAEGYVLTSSLSYEMIWVDIDRWVWVDADSLTLRAEPSTDSEVVATLPNETRLHCFSVSDKWYKVVTDGGLEGYVYCSFTTTNAPATPTPVPRPNTGSGSSSGGGGGGGSYSGGSYVVTGMNGSSVVSVAQSLLGVSYVYGGESSSGVDCSGLVVYCYRAIGVGGIPHYANSITSVGVGVSRDNIQPGDVVCYDYGGGYCGHVGIYVGGGQVIHASNSRGNVRYGNLDMMPILTIRRFVG